MVNLGLLSHLHLLLLMLVYISAFLLITIHKFMALFHSELILVSVIMYTQTIT